MGSLLWGELEFDWMKRTEEPVMPPIVVPPVIVLEPTPLFQLAEWMRDGKWLDMRVDVDDVGVLQRVKIVEILVRMEDEQIYVHQEWLDRDDHKHTTTIIIEDAEAIWDCGPTQVSLLDVKPLRSQPEPPQPRRPVEEDELDAVTKHITDAVLAACKLAFGVDPLDPWTWKVSHHRHQCIIVMYETTNLTASAICRKVFDYASPTPFVSARYKMDDDGFRTGCETIIKLLDLRVVPKPRTTRRFPADYKPVIR